MLTGGGNRRPIVKDTYGEEMKLQKIQKRIKDVWKLNRDAKLELKIDAFNLNSRGKNDLYKPNSEEGMLLKQGENGKEYDIRRLFRIRRVHKDLKTLSTQLHLIRAINVMNASLILVS